MPVKFPHVSKEGYDTTVSQILFKGEVDTATSMKVACRRLAALRQSYKGWEK